MLPLVSCISGVYRTVEASALQISKGIARRFFGWVFSYMCVCHRTELVSAFEDSCKLRAKLKKHVRLENT